MDHQELLNAYVFPYRTRKNPDVSKKILGLLYVSNQKYFTLEDICGELDSDRNTITEVVEELVNQGEVSCRIPKSDKLNLRFYLNIKGLVIGLQHAIKDNLVFTEVLERTIARRDNSNAELNQFIRKSIVLNSEVADFVKERIKEYFKDKI